MVAQGAALGTCDGRLRRALKGRHKPEIAALITVYCLSVRLMSVKSGSRITSRNNTVQRNRMNLMKFLEGSPHVDSALFGQRGRA